MEAIINVNAGGIVLFWFFRKESLCDVGIRLVSERVGNYLRRQPVKFTGVIVA